MPLEKIRAELDLIDNVIADMLALRMSVIPVVAYIKKKNDLPLHQPGREKVIYDRLEAFGAANGISPELLKDIYKRIIVEALQIEERYIALDPSDEFDADFDEVKSLARDLISKIGTIRAKAKAKGKTLVAAGTSYFSTE
ncbi:MAG: chorismate mutase [Alphaproteobacteria bacterium]|nr:chorismate mutase [Alphaproteobacteria bacterium]